MIPVRSSAITAAAAIAAFAALACVQPAQAAPTVATDAAVSRVGAQAASLTPGDTKQAPAGTLTAADPTVHGPSATSQRSLLSGLSDLLAGAESMVATELSALSGLLTGGGGSMVTG